MAVAMSSILHTFKKVDTVGVSLWALHGGLDHAEIAYAFGPCAACSVPSVV
jgi:hypothetical protein